MSSITYFPVTVRDSRTVFIVVVCASMLIVFNIYKLGVDVSFGQNKMGIIGLHNSIVDQFYQSRKSWELSELGAVLYKNAEYPSISEEKRNKRFVILIWKHWNALKNRHLYYFGSVRQDPLKDCSVKNCEFIGDDSKLESADAVIIHLHRGQIPKVEHRNENQRWIFLNDEAPYNTFSLSRQNVKISDLKNIFNWSMTFSSKADIPVPYGRTVALAVPKLPSLDDVSLPNLVPNWNIKKRDIPAAILVSNCGVSYRRNVMDELKKYLAYDAYGKCGNKTLKNSCPGHFRHDCEVMSQYLFYLVLENSKCEEYMTEKLFHNAYFRGAIPVIQGPSVEECELFLPPDSYLHLDNYLTLKELADDIIRISRDDSKLLHYHKWRNNFKVENEHGYFGTKSFHLCRACEAMNYNNDKKTVYSEKDLRKFLDPSILCRK